MTQRTRRRSRAPSEPARLSGILAGTPPSSTDKRAGRIRADGGSSRCARTMVSAAPRTDQGAAVPGAGGARPQLGDMLAAVAGELCHEMWLEPGDIQLLNNHVIYHGPSGYEDAAGADAGRLLLRLWLAVPNSRALPAGFEVLWGDVAPGAPRGGIAQPGS